MVRRSVVVGLLAWVSVVAVASGVTWAVIDTAGQQVFSDQESSGAVPGLTEAVSPTSGSSPSAAASGRASGTGSPTGGPSGTRGRPDASPGADARPEPTYTERAWQGPPGVVVARCNGSEADLRSATPNDDIFVEVEKDGPSEVEVKFESASGAEVKVRVECAGGVPRFEVESDSEED